MHALGEPQVEFMIERTESAHSVVKEDFDPRRESRLWESESGDICFPSWSSTVGIMIVLILVHYQLFAYIPHCTSPNAHLGEKHVVRTTLQLDESIQADFKMLQFRTKNILGRKEI